MRIFEIKNEYHYLRLLDHGATIFEWLCFSDKTSIILNNDDFEVYKDSTKGYFGSTIGRVANRIKDGTFLLNDVTYNLPKNYINKHHIHGNPEGFNTKIFDVIYHDNHKIVFRHISPDMHNGFPGEIKLDVTYELIDKTMKMSYEATSSKDTILNITNHMHFNLGDETILDHFLEMSADRYLEIDDELIPTGKVLSVSNTPLDFSVKKSLKDGILPLKDTITKGIDHAYIFKNESHKYIKLSFKNKLLEIKTSYPGTQVYTVNRKFTQKRLGGADIPLYGGVAFECQLDPDGIHHENFNSMILKKDQRYQHYISYTISES